MLIKGNYAKLTEVDDHNLNECIEYCWKHFFYRLHESFKVSHPYDKTTEMYDKLDYGTKQSFNLENIVYECYLYDYLNNFILFYRDKDSDCWHGETKETPVTYKIDQTGFYVNKIEVTTENGYNGDLSHYFGVGEFPFLNFKIIKLGNREYFTYKICR